MTPNTPVALAFTPDGKGFFAAGDSWVVKHRLGDDTPDIAFSPDPDGLDNLRDMRLSADGKALRVLVGSEPGEVREYDPDTGKLLTTLKQPGTVVVDHFSRLHPDDKTILGNRNGRVWRWDAATGTGPVYDPMGTLMQSAFAPDGKTVRTISNGNVRYTWDAATGRATADPTPVPDALAWDRTLSRVVEAVGETAVVVREVDTGRELVRVPCVNPQAGTVFFQPDATGDDLLAAVSDKGTAFWYVARGRRLFALPFVCDRPVVLSAGRRTAFALDPDETGVMHVWETASGRRQATEYPNCDLPAASPDGRHVWALGRGTNPLLVRIDATTAKASGIVRIPVWMGGLCVSADGRRVAGFNSEAETLTVLDTATGQPTHTFHAANPTPAHIAFNADGTRLVTSGVEGVAYVWNLSRPVPLAETPQPAAFRDATAAVHALRNDDAAVAHLGMTWLHAHPADGLTALAAAFPPAVAVPAARLEQLLADRDSANFKTRLKADKELAKFGPLAEEGLKAEAEKPRSEEVRAAVEVLLAKLNAEVPSGERLAELRAVEVVERVGTAEAVKVLTAWAAGAATATLTSEAKAVLARRPGAK